MVHRSLASVLIAIPALALAAPARAQSAPDDVVTESMSLLTRLYGDANEHLVYTDSSSNDLVLAHGTSTAPAIYTAGDTIYTGEGLFFCQQDASGGLSSCQTAESLAAAEGETDSGCVPGPNGEQVCFCHKFLACVPLSASDCAEPLECNGDVCVCPFP